MIRTGFVPAQIQLRTFAQSLKNGFDAKIRAKADFGMSTFDFWSGTFACLIHGNTHTKSVKTYLWKRTPHYFPFYIIRSKTDYTIPNVMIATSSNSNSQASDHNHRAIILIKAQAQNLNLDFSQWIVLFFHKFMTFFLISSINSSDYCRFEYVLNPFTW